MPPLKKSKHKKTVERDSFKTHSLMSEDGFLKIKQDKHLLFLFPFFLFGKIMLKPPVHL
jgi:hypothetical protein